MHKIIVTGATGNTGSMVLRQLSEMNIACSALVRNTNNVPDIPGVNWIEGTFDDVQSLITAFAGVEKVYVAMPAHPFNVQWTRNLIDAAEDAGVKHIVKLSGMGAHTDAGSEIIRVHAITDAIIMDSGIEYTILQPNSFYQNVFSSIGTIKESGAMYMSLGDAKQSFIDIRDVAAVAVKALTENGHENAVYKLSGPAALSYYDIAQIVGETLGKTVTYYPITDDQMKAGLLSAGLPEWGAASIAEIFHWFAQGGYEEVTNNVETVLGRKPYRFDEFMVAHREMFQ